MNRLLLAVTISICLADTVLGYEINVHQKISLNAVATSNIAHILMTNLATHLGDKYSDGTDRKTVSQWIELGSIREDDNTSMRWLNHFFDPTTGKGLNPCNKYVCSSSLTWGKQASSNPWNWMSARESFYKALTDRNPKYRDGYFSYLYRTIGQIVHLLQDKAVPAHVRNDPHNLPGINYDMYEMFTKQPKNLEKLIYDEYSSVELTTFNTFESFWTNIGKGLAEYSNRNFLSLDTNIDDRKYFLPIATGDWIGLETITDPWMGAMDFEVKYLQGYVTDQYRPSESRPISRLSAYSYYDFEMQRHGYSERVYSLNDKIHKEYSSFLIPRAVGYSAGLLDYFFRGDIKLEFQPGSSPGYAIINNSKEDMTGRFEVYYDNIQDERIQLRNWPLTISASQSARVDLPIAADAKEPGKYILVFIGKMGNEEGAVAGYVTGRVLQINPPSEHVYSQIDPKTEQAFTKIGLKIKNTSSEAMPNGSLQAIVRYKKPGQAVYSYAISAPKAGQQLAPSASQEVYFDFSGSPIPLDATNVYLYVVYTGAIGTEKNAVAVGERDISEPTPVDLFNNMDRVCMKSEDLAGNGLWYTAGSAAAIELVDTNKNRIANEWDVYAHNATDIYIRFSEGKEPLKASPAEYNFKVAKIDAGTGLRALYILSEYTFNYSFYYSWTTVEGSNDPWYHVNTTHSYIGTALINQTETTSDKAECGSRSSCTSTSNPYYYPYRGTSMWWGAGFIFINRPYPDSATCQN